jgi:hypothetical protein
MINLIDSTFILFVSRKKKIKKLNKIIKMHCTEGYCPHFLLNTTFINAFSDKNIHKDEYVRINLH